MTRRLTMINVNEVYDRCTVQGEGPSLGRLCTFVRLARCNLNCGEGEGSTWACDTPFTWRWRGIYPDTEDRPAWDPSLEVHQMCVGDVADAVYKTGAPLVVISGGEPMVQRGGLEALVDELRSYGLSIEIETNGTQAPWLGIVMPGVDFNVSPKLSNSGVPRKLAWSKQALVGLQSTGHARFKFVCSDTADLDEVQELIDLAELRPGLVWIMPAGASRSGIRQSLGRIADQAIERGWNVTTRLQIDLWGNQRGV